MATIDIRDLDDGLVDEIVFSNYDLAGNYFIAVSLTTDLDKNYIKIKNDDSDYLIIKKNSIGDLIRALQKAQEIWKEE